MTSKPLRFRRAARMDVNDGVAYLGDKAGFAAVADFVDDLRDAYRLIRNWPGSGSPRYGVQLAIPGLRHQRLRRHPYLIFYVERSDTVEVWRVLHGSRDIPDAVRPVD